MPSFVQGAHSHGGITATFGVGVTAGNTVVGICSFAEPDSLNSVTDGTNAYTVLDSFDDTGNTQKAATFYAPNVASGATTIQVNGPSSAISISIAEYSGVVSAPLDGHTGQIQTTPGTGSNAITSTAITTTVAGDIVVGLVAGTSGQAATFSAGTSPNAFTSRATTTDSGSPSTANLQIEDFVQSGAGSIAATFTQNAAGSTICFVLGLKGPAVAGGVLLPGTFTVSPILQVRNQVLGY